MLIGVYMMINCLIFAVIFVIVIALYKLHLHQVRKDIELYDDLVSMSKCMLGTRLVDALEKMIHAWNDENGWCSPNDWSGYNNGYPIIFQYLEHPIYFSKNIEFDKDERNMILLSQLEETEREFLLEYDRILRWLVK
jgi:hypothetical protein